MFPARLRLYGLSTIWFFALLISGGAGLRAQPLCSVTPTIKPSTAGNMFNSQQERILGDIEAEELEKVYPAVHDDRLEAHLNAVLARLPHDQFQVRALLLDAPEANAFSVGPGRIYVTTKMVAFLKTDDELAGLLGHELGHIQMHQNAIIVSRLFHAILHVNSVSDRQDILDKFGRMMTSLDRTASALRTTAQILSSQEATSESAADRFSMFASAAAGFSPRANIELVDRSGSNSSGGLMTHFAAAGSSNGQRLKEMKQTFKRLPRPCQELEPSDSAEFRAWQSSVISFADLATR